MAAVTRPARRYRARFFFVLAAAIVLAAVFLVRSCTGPVTGDFRDPAILARAIEVSAQRPGDGTPTSASCSRLVFPDFVCSVAFGDGATVTYDVRVAADGSSWSRI
jgi:hypothetical protein